MSYNTIEELKKLPKEVQIQVAERVGGGFGSDVHVEREYGRYDVLSCVCLRKYYAPDFKSWNFNRQTVEKDPELKQIVKQQDKEYEDWLDNEGKDFDWEAFAQ